MSSENMIIFGVIVLLIVVIVVARIVIRKAVNKGADAIHNARVKSKEEKNPPEKENLADRYNNTTE